MPDTSNFPDIYNPLWTFFFIFFLIFNIFLWAHHHSFQKGGITKTKPQEPVRGNIPTEEVYKSATPFDEMGTDIADQAPMTATTSL